MRIVVLGGSINKLGNQNITLSYLGHKKEICFGGIRFREYETQFTLSEDCDGVYVLVPTVSLNNECWVMELWPSTIIHALVGMKGIFFETLGATPLGDILYVFSWTTYKIIAHDLLQDAEKKRIKDMN